MPHLEGGAQWPPKGPGAERPRAPGDAPVVSEAPWLDWRLMDIGTFLVQRVIIHEIPKAKLSEKSEKPISYSDTPSPLDDAKRGYFRRRILRSLEKAFDVERDPAETSPVPMCLLTLFGEDADDETFVLMSKSIAGHLYACQGGSSSAGLVSLVEGTIGTGRRAGRCLAILKLEMEPGVHIEPVEVDGKRTFEVTVEDVTLTETTRVFKASLFPRFSELDKLGGLVSDDQLESPTIGRDIAEFFLRKFLGCRMALIPSEQTKQFIERAMRHFNSLDDDETKLRYEVALRAALESESPTLDVTEFARSYMKEADRDTFVNAFRDDEGRIAPIEKDLSRVQRFIDESWVILDNGVRLMGPPAEVEKTLTAIRTAVDEHGEPIVRASVKSTR